MRRTDVESGIYSSWAFLSKIGLALSFSNPATLPVDREFRDLALNPDTAYKDLYMNGLQNSHYNILLIDHSYLQFGWTSDDDIRFAFYANPFVLNGKGLDNFKKIKDLFEADMLDFEQYSTLLNDAKPESRIPLIRYENSPAQHRGLQHPCSHFHIGHHSENRWAVKRILTPCAFSMLIAKQYYSEFWDTCNTEQTGKSLKVLDEHFINERLACREVDADYFDEHEERSFHFG